MDRIKAFLRALVAVVITITLFGSCSKDGEETMYISSKAALINFRNTINGGNTDVNGVLTADIDLSGEVWVPIGVDYDTPFEAAFYGNGYSISNLSVSSSGDYQGLFGYIDYGSVSNLTLVNPSVVGDDYVGALCGKINKGFITDCSVEGGSVSGSRYIGGVVGYSYSTYLSANTNSADVSGYEHVGGVLGSASSATFLTACDNDGSISSTSYYAGGVVGYAYSNVTLTACFSTGRVYSGTVFAGGVAGYTFNTTLTACSFVDQEDDNAIYGIGDDAESIGVETLTTIAELNEASRIVAMNSAIEEFDILKNSVVIPYRYEAGSPADSVTPQIYSVE